MSDDMGDSIFHNFLGKLTSFGRGDQGHKILGLRKTGRSVYPSCRNLKNQSTTMRDEFLSQSAPQDSFGGVKHFEYTIENFFLTHFTT